MYLGAMRLLVQLHPGFVQKNCISVDFEQAMHSHRKS